MKRYLDLSNNNASVDLAQVKKDGIAGVILKATEGATYVDDTFASRYRDAKAVGLQRGAYCFARPETSNALVEANHFVETVGACGGFDVWPELDERIPAVLDLEDHGQLDKDGLLEYATIWLTRVEELTGKKGGLYTGEAFCQQYGLEVIESKGYFLWIAAYGQNQPDLKEVLWQETDAAHVAGIVGNVDEDVLTPLNPVLSTQYIDYYVWGGDSLSSIAVKYHTTIAELMKLNPHITNPNLIRVGDRLRIPMR